MGTLYRARLAWLGFVVATALVLPRCGEDAARTGATKPVGTVEKMGYPSHTPPPVIEHLAKGGEAWAVLAATDSGLGGQQGFREWWLLSADRSKFEQLVPVDPLTEEALARGASWYSITPLNEMTTQGDDKQRVALQVTPKLTSTDVGLILHSTSTNKTPDGEVVTLVEITRGFRFPDPEDSSAVTGFERTIGSNLLNGKLSSEPRREERPLLLQRVRKPNPLPAATKGKP